MSGMTKYRQYLPLLQPGDRVAVITPSGPVDPIRLANGCKTLEAWGLEPILGSHIRTEGETTAETDSGRAHDLQWALESSDIAGVFCGRGGYGVVRILDRLDWPAIAKSDAKPVVGFSDLTALHVALVERLGWASVLGVHVAGGLSHPNADNPSSNALRSLLFDGQLPDVFMQQTRVIRPGCATAVPLRGGNLTMLAAMCGSAEGRAPKTPFIAVLEDINEAPYRVDRMLTQLLRAGWFDHAVGVLCGSWEGCHGDSLPESHVPVASREFDQTPRTELEAVLFERLATVSGLLVIGAPFGHGAGQLPIPMGIPVVLDAARRRMNFAE